MRQLGLAEIDIVDGYIKAKAKDGLKGGNINFSNVTVTGTENAIMAGVLAKGTTTISNAAKEPEVVDLVACLRKWVQKFLGREPIELKLMG